MRVSIDGVTCPHPFTQVTGFGSYLLSSVSDYTQPVLVLDGALLALMVLPWSDSKDGRSIISRYLSSLKLLVFPFSFESFVLFYTLYFYNVFNYL